MSATAWSPTVADEYSVLATVDPSDVAHLLVAEIEGTLSLARTPKTPGP